MKRFLIVLTLTAVARVVLLGPAAADPGSRTTVAQLQLCCPTGGE